MVKRRNLKTEIEDYCGKMSVSIPVGFHRHTPSRYAIVKIDSSGGKKLIATTWFRVADLTYYIENNLNEQDYELIDFDARSYFERKGTRVFKTTSLDEAS